MFGYSFYFGHLQHQDFGDGLNQDKENEIQVNQSVGNLKLKKKKNTHNFFTVQLSCFSLCLE